MYAMISYHLKRKILYLKYILTIDKNMPIKPLNPNLRIKGFNWVCFPEIWLLFIEGQ